MRIESGVPRAREYERLVREVASSLGVQVDFPQARWSVLALTRTLERLREKGLPLAAAPEEWGRVVSERDWDSLLSLKDAQRLTRQDLKDAQADVRRLRARARDVMKECDDEVTKAQARVSDLERRVKEIDSYVTRRVEE